MVILGMVNYWENDGSISENWCGLLVDVPITQPSVEEEKFHHGHSVPHISHQKSGSKVVPPSSKLAYQTSSLVPSPINPTVSLDQMT